jgi:hypothetical protein
MGDPRTMAMAMAIIEITIEIETIVNDNLSEHKTVQKIKQMNTPKETFKNATAILSLVWSVGKIQDWLHHEHYR